MAHLVTDIVKYLRFDERDIDNWLCKLFHKGGVVLFLTGSLVGIVSQYFGEPISCDFKGVDVEMSTDYCWIHGSSYIPKEYQRHMKCIVDLDGIESADDAPDTSYYQWVTFMLVFQAGTFLLPHKIWKVMEGGLIAAFGDDARSAIILRSETDLGEAVPMEILVEKYVRYFMSVFHRNNWYFFQFVCIEFSYMIVLFFNFWMTDKFLHGKFRSYGWDVLMYSQLTKREQRNTVNPMCQVFPTEVSCTVPNVGAAGGEQNHNGLCILTQNIINEKMYLVIWSYLVLLMVISLPYFLFRLCTILFDKVRYTILMTSVGTTNDKEAKKSINYILLKCKVGDWFLLNQLGKNVNTYFFRAFVKELRCQLKSKPAKRSFSSVSDATLKSPHKPRAEMAEQKLVPKKLAQLSNDSSDESENERTNNINDEFL